MTWQVLFNVKWASVLEKNRFHLRRQRCSAPAVFLLTSSLPPGCVKCHSEAPQTQFLQRSFLSAGQPPDRLYRSSQPVRASHVWTWVQGEPLEGRHLPQCTGTKHHGRSRSSSCCSTMGKKQLLPLVIFRYTAKEESLILLPNVANEEHLVVHN